MSTILVTTANGQVGRAMLQPLVAAGHRVLAGVHSPATFKPIPGVEPVVFDFADPASIQKTLQGVDGLFLNSPPLFPNAPESVGQVIELARAAGVRHLVLMTNLLAEADPSSDHRRLELRLFEGGVPWTILRPGFFMQNFITQAGASIKAEGAFYFPAGQGVVGYVDAHDIAEVGARVLSETGHEGRIYHITGPALLRMAEVATQLGQALGREIRYVDIPGEAFRGALLGLGLPEAAANFMTFLYDSAVRNNWAARLSGDVEQVLGRPARSFADFAAEHLEALR